MRSLLDADFPPKGSHVLSRTDRRCVLLTISHQPGVLATVDHVDISVWLRTDVKGMRDWFCSPDSGITLPADCVRELSRILAEELR